MANLQAITKGEFTSKSWRPNSDFLFCAGDAVCPLAASELPRAMMGMPIAFVENDGEYSIVSVQGLEQGANYFVGPNGQWRGNYIPAFYRTYPFVLASGDSDSDQLIVCIDKDSGQLVEDDSKEPFFDIDGELTPTMKDVVELLANMRAGRLASLRICENLLEHDLLIPWEIELEISEGLTRVDGLYCINESTLNSLSDEAYIQLRKAGAIPAIYSQLLSMQRMQLLTKFAETKYAQKATEELDLDGLITDGNINFDNF